ncbi:ACT domain-containing protein [Azotobacter chroococcum]|nr:ACT domain-containing protein [Azotobacter chroococcum]
MAKPKLKLLATKFTVWKTGKETPTGDVKVFALIAEENVNTVICSREQSLPDALEKSDDWCAIKLDTVLDMSESGILNAVTFPLAAAGISILAISSFDTDYLFVRNDDIGKAIEALRAAGYEISNEGAG